MSSAMMSVKVKSKAGLFGHMNDNFTHIPIDITYNKALAKTILETVTSLLTNNPVYCIIIT